MSNEVVEREQSNVVPMTQPTPAHMLQVALERGTSMEQLEKLMDLQQRWEANEARKAFAAAMAAFRAEAPVIAKNAEVDFTSSKGRTHYRHASLDHITAKVNPVLGRHGLTYSWVTEQSNGAVTVHCDLMHVMGHRERVTLTGPRDESGNKNSIQSIGSACTYLQRYTLVSALGLSTGGEDDDGHGEQPQETITDEQAAELKSLIRETGADTKLFLNAMGGAPSVDELPAGMFNRAKNGLLRKKVQQQGGKDAGS